MKEAPQNQMKRIAIVMYPWTGYLHGVQVGISEYFVRRPDWLWVSSLPRADDFARLAAQKPSGVIAFVEEEYLEDIRRLKVPVVDVSNWITDSCFPQVLCDDEAVGRLAANYLMELGIRHFAATGVRQAHFSDLRIKGYVDTLESKGFAVAFPALTEARRGGAKTERESTPAALNRRLRDLPKPCAIFAANDANAMALLHSCREAGLRVPEDVCVLGVDNDELLTRVSHPPLSSIMVPSEKIGFEAARVLDQMMNGRPAPTEPVLLAPIGVETRQSTNLLAVTDEDVNSAIRFIRENLHARINVEDILEVVPVNRRYLERKFKTFLGRSPLQEIRRVRIEKGKELLTTTDCSVSEVARRSGFPSPERFASVFHLIVGTTPGKYRKAYRLND